MSLSFHLKRSLNPWRRARWRLRLVLWGFAALAGLAVAGFAKGADLALAFFFALDRHWPWLPLFWTPFIGMVSVALTQKVFPGIQGSGIPQVIAATRLVAQGKPVHHLVSLRIAVGKVLVGLLALTGGFSAGREGPSVQVSASLVFLAHRYLPRSRVLRPSDLILAGGAAGVAAAFNTPLAGVVFAIEELGRRLETRTSGVLLGVIIISGLTSIALLGNYNYFGHITLHDLDYHILGPVLVSGVVCGLLGGLFSRLLLWPQNGRAWGLWRWRQENPVVFAGICGVLIAVLGLLTHGLSFGSGYTLSLPLVNGGVQGVPWYTSPARFLATVLSYHSGIPGGIFAPALAVGSTLGATLAPALGSHDLIPWVTLCMAGFLAAVTQAPITAALIVIEMVDGHRMALPLMAVTFLARAISAYFGPELYQQLALRFAEDRRGSGVRSAGSREDA
ncbi:MAG: chloride channel protein [Ferrovum sp.]|jgi:H+/Cl- antiporter ClcA|nr:chloride channel protein [Ferrovum sp.]NDU88341.1 chloride channel protein [Ferrovum sp.]